MQKYSTHHPEKVPERREEAVEGSNNGTDPARELARLAQDIAEAYAFSEHSPSHVVEAVVAAASIVGEAGQAKTSAVEAGMSAEAVRSVALTKLPNVPDVFTSKLERYTNSDGQVRSKTPTFTAGYKPNRASEICKELGIAPRCVGEAMRRCGEGGSVRHGLGRELERAAAGAGWDGGEGARAGTREGGNGCPYGCNGRSESPHRNRRSERSERKTDADEAQGTPPAGDGDNPAAGADFRAVGTKAQREFLDVHSRSRAERLAFLDLVAWARSGSYHEQSEEDRYKVITASTIRNDYGGPYKTKKVWDGSALIKPYKGGAYVPEQKARMFKIYDEVLDKWTELGAEGSRRWRLDTPRPRRTDEPSPLRTHVQDDNGRNYPEIVDKALRVLKDAKHMIDTGAIDEAEEILASRDGQTSRQRLHNLRMARETLERQTTGQEEGLSVITNAYDVQELSGRTQFKNGGPMNLPVAVKHSAYAHYTNYDIKSCHTAALKQVADWLEELGVDIDTSALDEIPDKYDVADDTGIPVTLVKIVEHAVKYGAVIPKSLDQAEHFYEAETGHYPEIAEAAEKHAKDPDEALSTLYEIYEPVRRVVKRIAKALLGEYYDEHAKGGWMKNTCGVSFAPHNWEEGHERESKVMAWMLQGLEAAFVHSITILSTEHDYTVVANEHDGAIVDGEVPDEAIRRARDMSGFGRADFVEKDFADEEEIEELYGAEEAEEETEEEAAEEAAEEAREEAQEQAEGEGQDGTCSTQSGTQDAVEAYLEKRRRVAEGQVPDDPHEAIEQGFSMQEWKAAQKQSVKKV